MAEVDDPIETAPIGSRGANYAVVNRIRDLAKWLLVVLGAIAGVLLTGSKLSDIGATHGSDRCWALVGVGVGLLGAAIALWFIARVLLPIRLTLSGLAKEKPKREGEATGLRALWWRLRWPIHGLIAEEPGVLADQTSITDLRTARENARTKEKAAKENLASADTTDRWTRGKELEEAQENRRETDEAVYEFLAYALAEKVKRRMVWASGAVAFGAAISAIGIVLFSIHINEGESSSVGDLVPRRLSPVVVRLTPAGHKQLADALGPGCQATRLRAIVVGGPPDAPRMTTVPGGGCRAAHFTLEPDMGSAVTQGSMPSLRACTTPQPHMPCIVYPDSAALIAGEPHG